MKSDEQRAQEALMKLAQRKAEQLEIPQKIEKKAKASLKDLGVSEDMMKYGAGAAKLADMIGKQELEGTVGLTDNLRLQGKINPREQALKLLYKKGF